jgi:cyclohexadieny/prephenate dehydrogenase
MQIRTLAIVGVGLIGTAVGLAAKHKKVAERVIGFDRNPAHLDTALLRGAIDEACKDLKEAVSQADIVVFCVPVDCVVNEVLSAAPFCRPDTLLTDVGSAKSEIVNSIENALSCSVCFVGAHPLAGSEKEGPSLAQPHLFEGRTTIVVRTSKTQEDALTKACKFWEALGTHAVIMTPEQHDRAMAYVSHLPHLTAAALAGMAPSELVHLAASGFRDMTRIASGNPSLWVGIFLQNRHNLLASLGQLQDRLNQFRSALEAPDPSSLVSLLDQAKKVRDALGN